MAIVTGVDLGTLSVRVSLVDSERGLLASAVQEYPLHRKREDPEYATQSRRRRMRLAAARRSIEQGGRVGAIRFWRLRSTPRDRRSFPSVVICSRWTIVSLSCDHGTRARRRRSPKQRSERDWKQFSGAEACIHRSGDFGKVLHWLRHNPATRSELPPRSSTRHRLLRCVGSPITAVTRSVCAMGHKWLWNADWGAPAAKFFKGGSVAAAGITRNIGWRISTSDKIAGKLCPLWAERLKLKAGIPVPVDAFDAHWDAIGAGSKWRHGQRH